MADQLFLSYWIRGFDSHTMLPSWERMLRPFPYSKLARWPSTLRVHAVGYQEPPLREEAFPSPLDVGAVVEVAREVVADDCAYVLEAFWDLWQSGAEWSVQPARASLACFGPRFESETDENLRLELGLDKLFLPHPRDPPGSAALVESNIRSLLHLVHQIDDQFPSARRRLWTESGGNFAERLHSLLEGLE